jgi:hypothetical protein
MKKKSPRSKCINSNCISISINILYICGGTPVTTDIHHIDNHTVVLHVF